MKPLGLGYQKIDICPNFCMLYYLENAEMTECMTCGHSRYKPRTGRGKTLVAYKKLKYFPITPRLQRLFMSLRTAEHMTWHQSHHAVDGVMVHPSDGEAWKHFNSMHPPFSAESRNVRLGLGQKSWMLFLALLVEKRMLLKKMITKLKSVMNLMITIQ